MYLCQIQFAQKVSTCLFELLWWNSTWLLVILMMSTTICTSFIYTFNLYSYPTQIKVTTCCKWMGFNMIVGTHYDGYNNTHCLSLTYSILNLYQTQIKICTCFKQMWSDSIWLLVLLTTMMSTTILIIFHLHIPFCIHIKHN